MRPSVRGLTAAVAVAFLAAACGNSPASTSATDSRLFTRGLTDVAAAVALPDGGLRVGLRKTGEIKDLDASGEPGPALVKLTVRTGGQRGLLGLTVDAQDRTFAAWTRPDARLVVGQVLPGPIRLVWEGPASTDLANGGHLDVLAGRIVIGIGDLLDRKAQASPTTINGKFLTLDPDGAPDQIPKILSGGWNNPFAFTVLDDDSLWVADNAPADTGERLARAEATLAADDPVLSLPRGTAPSSIDHADANTLVVCGYKSGRLLEYRVAAGQRPRHTRTLATDCTTLVVVLSNGTIVYETARGLRSIPKGIPGER